MESKIKAVIFDMDGLLIDSEPLWREALFNVFQKYNFPIEKSRVSETMGMRVDEVVEYWYLRYPWEGISKEEISKNIINEIKVLIKEKGKVMKGVHQIINLFDEQKIPMAIASSSMQEVIEAVLEKISVREKMQIIHSAEHEEYGKPHPGVYITTAKKLGLAPEQCLAFEDSPNGIISAKAAKMKCVAVPCFDMVEDKRFNVADLVIDSLEDFTLENFKKLGV